MKTPRREFSRAVKRAAWGRANGACEAMLVTGFSRLGFPTVIRCNAPIGVGNFHYDHLDPDWYSKDNELENCQVLCRTCHAAKTKIDVGNIAKSKRIQDKRIKALTSRTPMPFGRGSRLKRKLDGSIVDRQTGLPVRS